MKDILEKAAQIKLVVFDVDGVLTDGSLFLGDGGEEYKAFYSKDGFGMKLLQDTGVEIGIITARKSEVVRYRMESMNIRHIYQGRLEKLPALEEMVKKTGFSFEQTAYVGDDVIDLPAMRRVGLAISVQDAHPLAWQHCHWQTPHPGGRGAARDVCELIMEAQNTLQAQLDKYLK